MQTLLCTKSKRASEAEWFWCGIQRRPEKAGAKRTDLRGSQWVILKRWYRRNRCTATTGTPTIPTTRTNENNGDTHYLPFARFPKRNTAFGGSRRSNLAKVTNESASCPFKLCFGSALTDCEQRRHWRPPNQIETGRATSKTPNIMVYLCVLIPFSHVKLSSESLPRSYAGSCKP